MGVSFLWRRRWDTLCHLFFRPLRMVPEKTALLETSQFQNANAHFELLRRTLLLKQKGSHPPAPYKQKKTP